MTATEPATEPSVTRFPRVRDSIVVLPVLYYPIGGGVELRPTRVAVDAILSYWPARPGSGPPRTIVKVRELPANVTVKMDVAELDQLLSWPAGPVIEHGWPT